MKGEGRKAEETACRLPLTAFGGERNAESARRQNGSRFQVDAGASSRAAIGTVVGAKRGISFSACTGKARIQDQSRFPPIIRGFDFRSFAIAPGTLAKPRPRMTGTKIEILPARASVGKTATMCP